MSDKNKEFEDLLEQVRNADLSINNPKILSVIENEISRWVCSYETKKKYFINNCDEKFYMRDCYGGPGEIPDLISINCEAYSPIQILEHVKKRDDLGTRVLKDIYSYHIQNELWVGNNLEKFIQELKMLGPDLNAVLILDSEGGNITLRDIMLGVINPTPKSIDITVGLEDAIMRLYNNPFNKFYNPNKN